MLCEEMPQGNESLALILSINTPLHTNGAQHGSHHKAEIALVELGRKKSSLCNEQNSSLETLKVERCFTDIKNNKLARKLANRARSEGVTMTVRRTGLRNHLFDEIGGSPTS